MKYSAILLILLIFIANCLLGQVGVPEGGFHVDQCSEDPCQNSIVPCDPNDPFQDSPIETEADIIQAIDPNEIIPPYSIPDEGWIRKDWDLPFMVNFENLPTASASAQRVEIRVPLGPNVDINSFELGHMGFYFYDVYVPPGVNFYQELITNTLYGLNVEITGGLDISNNEAFWVFQALDTLTGLPPTDHTFGFLPPNDTIANDGQGYVSFTFRAHPNSVTFDEIETVAEITFDDNDPISTSTSLLTVDADNPISGIDTIFYNPDTALYQVVLDGSDVGSGLKYVHLFMSIDGGQFQPILENLTHNTVFLRLEKGVEYSFFTLSRDSVDNKEPLKYGAEYTFTPTSLYLNIPLEEGWNLISSHFRPADLDMLNILAPIESQVVLIKDHNGIPTVPSIPLNALGDWQVPLGYQIKVTENTILPILGAPLAPEYTSVPIEAGWQIIPYLKNHPSKLEDELSGINWSIVIVKDNDGNIYFPALGIDNIQDLNPTKGYWLKSLHNAFLYYSSNDPYGGNPTIGQRSELSLLSHFVLNGLNTGSNASLIIPEEIIENTPISPMDEIGIFNSEGILCGAAVYEGGHLAFPIWGDDAQSDEIAEGLLEGEEFSMRVWNNSTDEEWNAAFTLKEGAPLFFTNEIYIVNGIELGNTTNTLSPRPEIYFNYYPNPSNGAVYFTLGLPHSTDVQLSIHSLDGKYTHAITHATYAKGLHEFTEDFSALPDGMYVIQVVSGGMSKAYKLVLSH